MTDNDRRTDGVSASNPVAEPDSQRLTDVNQSAGVATTTLDSIDARAQETVDVGIGVESGVTDDQWLVALCGLPGVGKSTVAKYIVEHIDATRLRTDVIRKELFEEPEYTEAERDAVYQTLYDRADAHLQEGGSVVLDATFAQARYRDPVQNIADDAEARFRFVRVVCEQSVVKERIARRNGVSDADFEVYQYFKRTFEPLEADHVTVDNSASKAETHEQVEQLF